MKGPRYSVHFRRRREGKTDYRARRYMLYSGKPRLVVRKSLKHIWAQIVMPDEKGDSVLVSSHSKELPDYGWNCSCSNTPAAYLTGLLCGVKARNAGIEEAILDMGLRDVVKGSAVFACLKGFADAGVPIPFNESVVPSDDRLTGQHIVNHYESLDEEERKKRFGGYLKNNVDVTAIPDFFEKTKEQILSKQE